MFTFRIILHVFINEDPGSEQALKPYWSQTREPAQRQAAAEPSQWKHNRWNQQEMAARDCTYNTFYHYFPKSSPFHITISGIFTYITV